MCICIVCMYTPRTSRYMCLRFYALFQMQKIKLPLVHQLADVHALHLKAHVNVDFPSVNVRVPYRAH